MKLSQSAYYKSIYDTPQITFNAAMRGDYKGMHLSGRYSEKRAKKAFIGVFDEYLDIFGLPKEYEEYLKKMIWAAEEFAHSTEPGEKWRYTIAQAREQEAISILGGESGQPFAVTCAMLSKLMGFGINPATVTVAEFYGYLKGVK